MGFLIYTQNKQSRNKRNNFNGVIANSKNLSKTLFKHKNCNSLYLKNVQFFVLNLTISVLLKNIVQKLKIISSKSVFL